MNALKMPITCVIIRINSNVLAMSIENLHITFLIYISLIANHHIEICKISHDLYLYQRLNHI